MKKFVYSILALAALSTASLAQNGRSYDQRDVQPFRDQRSTVKIVKSPLLVIKDERKLTNYQRLLLQGEYNSMGAHGGRR